MPQSRPAHRLILALLAAAAIWNAAPAAAGDELPALHWRSIGPFRGGRTRAAAGVDALPNVFYIGQVNGGVWKSEDYGRTWRPIFDGQPTQSIGAIAVAGADGRIVYVASGEGLHRPDLSVGDGIYRSADAGATWTHLGLRDGQQIPALAVDPRDSDRVFAAVLGHPYGANEERGVFRSTDGGKSWTKVLYVDANTGASDIEIDPRNPDVLYAALTESLLGPWEDGNQYDGTHGGLYKSVDGGSTWRRLAQGLPENLVQIQVAVSPSDPARLYATVATTEKGSYGSAAGLGFYRSDDAGETWRKATEDPRPAMKIGGGDLPVPRVDPKNPDVVYSASIVTCRSLDGGRTWTSLRGAPGGDDYQNLWINGENPRIILLVGDQGAVISVNGGATWSSWYNQPTAQLYHVAVTEEFPYRVCGAQQESGSACISSRGNDGSITFRDWHPAGIIEYGYAAPDPRNPGIIYGAGRAEVSRFESATRQTENVTPIPTHDERYRTDRTEPLLFSPIDPTRMFYAANVVFETGDGGRNWRAISPDLTAEHTGQLPNLAELPAAAAAKRRGAIYSLAASYHDVNTLWAGTDDGLLWITHDHGTHWQSITPPGVAAWSKVTQISASRFDERTAYVSVSRMRVDDRRPYLYRTHDGGATWQSIAVGLPQDSPVNTVREDPHRPGLLFAGTENSVWFSTDEGGHWRSLQYDLPHTSMRDLWIKDDDLIVATHGRSFWILDDIAPLRELDRPRDAGGALLFSPAPAYRIRRSGNTDTPLPPDEPSGENPPDGAPIDYALPARSAGKVVLEILDAHGATVRRYASDDAPESGGENPGRELIPAYWVRPRQTLSAAPGMHRFVWDLRYAPPLAVRYEYPISAVPYDTPREPLGPLALPGEYRVRLTVGGRTASASLEVRMDPRVHASGEDLARLCDAQRRLAELLGSGAQAALRAHSVSEQLVARRTTDPSEVKEDLQALGLQLTPLLEGGHDGDADAPGLDAMTGRVAALYLQVGQADAAPTGAQEAAAARLARELDPLVARWRQIEESTLPTLNRRLRAARLQPIDVRQRPRTVPAEADED